MMTVCLSPPCVYPLAHAVFVSLLRVSVAYFLLQRLMANEISTHPSFEDDDQGTGNLPPQLIEGPPKHKIFTFRPGESSTIILPCIALHTTVYYWWKDGHLLSKLAGETGHLTVILSSTSGGRYQCQASNAFGVAVSNITNLLPAVLEYLKENDRGDTTHVVHGHLGDRVVLPCDHVISRPAPVYRWTVCEDKDKVACFTPHLLTSHTLAILDSGELVLDNVTQELLSYLYRCDVFNVALRRRIISNYVTIANDWQARGEEDTAGPAPFVLLWASPSPTLALVGSNVTLACYINSEAGVVSWELDGGDLASGTRLTLNKVQGRLTIADVRASDTGTYTCYVDHEHTDGSYGNMSASIELHVVKAPTITTRPTSLTAPARSPVTFYCQATGLPSPHIHWLINNVSLSDINDVHWYTSDNGGQLHLEHLTAFTTFTVTCNASNEHDYDLVSAVLRVTDYPTTTASAPATYGMPTTAANSTSVRIFSHSFAFSVDHDIRGPISVLNTTLPHGNGLTPNNRSAHRSATKLSKTITMATAMSLMIGSFVVGAALLVAWFAIRRRLVCHHCDSYSVYKKERRSAVPIKEEAESVGAGLLTSGSCLSQLAIIPLQGLDEPNNSLSDGDSGVCDHSIYSLSLITELTSE